jgi:hypothetical protein
MLTRKLMAATFITLLSACSAECTAGGSDDDDGDGGSSSENTTSPQSSSASGEGGDGSPAGTGGGNGDGGNGSGGDPGAGGGGTEGGGYCALACEEAADCCAPGSQGCPGDYPYNVECVDNLCVNPGCSEDAQCQFGGTQPDYGCFTVDFGGTDYGLCSEQCDTDDDCETDGWVCLGESKDGSYCIPEPVDPVPCDDDDDCGGFGLCQDDGSCRCAGDDECTSEGYVCVE